MGSDPKVSRSTSFSSSNSSSVAVKITVLARPSGRNLGAVIVKSALPAVDAGKIANGMVRAWVAPACELHAHEDAFPFSHLESGRLPVDGVIGVDQVALDGQPHSGADLAPGGTVPGSLQGARWNGPARRQREVRASRLVGHPPVVRRAARDAHNMNHDEVRGIRVQFDRRGGREGPGSAPHEAAVQGDHFRAGNVAGAVLLMQLYRVPRAGRQGDRGLQLDLDQIEEALRASIEALRHPVSRGEVDPRARRRLPGAVGERQPSLDHHTSWSAQERLSRRCPVGVLHRDLETVALVRLDGRVGRAGRASDEGAGAVVHAVPLVLSGTAAAIRVGDAAQSRGESQADLHLARDLDPAAGSRRSRHVGEAVTPVPVGTRVATAEGVILQPCRDLSPPVPGESLLQQRWVTSRKLVSQCTILINC